MSYLTVQTPGLPAPIAAALQFETTSAYGPDGQFDGVIVASAKLVGEYPEGLIRAALLAADEACRPGGYELATREIAILRAKTASRPGETTDMLVAGAAFARDLARYPADVISEGCRRYADANRWWPAWADLKRECDRLIAKRLAERTALRKALEPPKPALYLGKPKPETRTERLRHSINAFLRHGYADRAASAERTLAGEEGRAPEDWARAAMPEDATKPERAPFKPGNSPTDRRCAELARQRRQPPPELPSGDGA